MQDYNNKKTTPVASYHYTPAESVVFTPDEREVLFLDNFECSEFSQLLYDNFEYFSEMFADDGYRLVCFSKIAEKISKNDLEFIQYKVPNYNPQNVVIKNDAKQLQDIFTSHFDNGDFRVTAPMFFHYSSYPFNLQDDKSYRYTAFDINKNTLQATIIAKMNGVFSDKEIDVVEYYIGLLVKQDKKENIRFHFVPSIEEDVKDSDFADKNFSKEAYQLIDEIKVRINKLKKMGVSDYVLNSIFNIEPELSPIVITKEFKIFLPLYNNMEISLAPLPKVVYLLFLKHHNGIIFKDLPDYRQELFEIYTKVSNRILQTDMVQSIYDITDPTKNSINEKCSRIREAFLKNLMITLHVTITLRAKEQHRKPFLSLPI